MPIFQPFPRGLVKLGFELIRPNEERGHKGILSWPKPEGEKEKLQRGKTLQKKKEMVGLKIDCFLLKKGFPLYFINLPDFRQIKINIKQVLIFSSVFLAELYYPINL
jgi:hypothetical protein